MFCNHRIGSYFCSHPIFCILSRRRIKIHSKHESHCCIFQSQFVFVFREPFISDHLELFLPSGGGGETRRGGRKQHTAIMEMLFSAAFHEQMVGNPAYTPPPTHYQQFCRSVKELRLGSNEQYLEIYRYIDFSLNSLKEKKNKI